MNASTLRVLVTGGTSGLGLALAARQESQTVKQG